MLRNILTAAGWIIVMVIALAELVLFFRLLKRYLYSKKFVCLDMAILTLGLFFDAAILSAGRFIGADTLLLALTKARLIVRTVVIPLILPICAYALDMKDSGKRVFWIITLLCMAAGVAAAVFTPLKTDDTAGIVRFCSSVGSAVTWHGLINQYLPLGILVIEIICGFVLIFKAKTLWFLLGGILNVGIHVRCLYFGYQDLLFLIGLFGELLMILCFWLYTRKLKKAYL